MALRARTRTIEEKERFRKKLIEMVTDFCLEASVLVSILGVLEAAIAWRGFPPFKDVLYSTGIGAIFFSVGCIIQFREATIEDQPSREEGDT